MLHADNALRNSRTPFVSRLKPPNISGINVPKIPKHLHPALATHDPRPGPNETLPLIKCVIAETLPCDFGSPLARPDRPAATAQRALPHTTHRLAPLLRCGLAPKVRQLPLKPVEPFVFSPEFPCLYLGSTCRTYSRECEFIFCLSFQHLYRTSQASHPFAPLHLIHKKRRSSMKLPVPSA